MIGQPLHYTRREFMHYLDRLNVPGGFMRYARLYDRFAADMQAQREVYALLDAGGFDRQRYDYERLWEKYARKIARGQMAFEFKEELHPRDDSGKFAEKAGGASKAEDKPRHKLGNRPIEELYDQFTDEELEAAAFEGDEDASMALLRRSLKTGGKAHQNLRQKQFDQAMELTKGASMVIMEGKNSSKLLIHPSTRKGYPQEDGWVQATRFSGNLSMGHEMHKAKAEAIKDGIRQGMKVTHIKNPGGQLEKISEGEGIKPEAGRSERKSADKADWKSRNIRSESFKRWFGDWEKDHENASKVVNNDGEPQENQGTAIRTVYHGTTEEFTTFSKEKIGRNATHVGNGFYFSENQTIAKTFAVRYDVSAEGGWQPHRTEGHVISAYLNIRRPYDFDSDATKEDIQRLTQAMTSLSTDDKMEKRHLTQAVDALSRAQLDITDRPFLKLEAWTILDEKIGRHRVNDILASAGWDGITHLSRDNRGTPRHREETNPSQGRIWIAFEPNQIKSTENEGTFDAENPDMRYSRKPSAGQMGFQFKEEDHPRDEEGKFAEKEKAAQPSDIEDAKYASYVEVMKAHNMPVDSPEIWLKRYREAQARIRAKDVAPTAPALDKQPTKEELDASKSPDTAAKQSDEVRTGQPEQPAAETETESTPAASAEADLPALREIPLNSEDPRKAAKEQLQRQIDEDYAYARKSSVRNTGEDILHSARHKANEWRSLEEAEEAGTAGKLVTREQLLKNEPHSLAAHLHRNPQTVLAMYLALKKFPSIPGYGKRKPSEETAKKDRRQFVESYRKIRDKAQDLAASEESPRRALERLHDYINQIIRELRGQKDSGSMTEVTAPDPYNNTANGLVQTSKATRWSLYRPKSTTVQHSLNEFDKLSKEHDDKTQTADRVGTILEGASINKAFGEASGKTRGKTLNLSQLYVRSAERVGGPKVSVGNITDANKTMMDDFGIRGIQYGNYVSDDERLHHLRQCAEAFADLADILEIPREYVSNKGTLGIAFGARGHGSALAHYEPSRQVINLTRNGGVGSLAHEWGHFFDRQLGSAHEGKSNWASEEFPSRVDTRRRVESGKIKVTDKNRFDEWYPPIPKEDRPLFDAFADVKESMQTSGYAARLRVALMAHEVSQKRQEYWTSPVEMFARTFERYIQRKLEKAERKNTYLAGIESKAWKQDENGFWPNDTEVDAMAPAFEAIFDAFREGIQKGRYSYFLSGGLPEKYALPVFEEAKHPRGKPKNPGQFREKGTASVGSGSQQPQAAKPQQSGQVPMQTRRVMFKGKPFSVTKHGDDWFYRSAGKTTAWTKANRATAAALDKALGQQVAQPQRESQQRAEGLQRAVGLDVPADSDNVLVNAVALGQARYLGQGQEGMVFAVANRAVKVSRSKSDRVAREAEINEKMRKAGVHGMLKTQLVRHGGRDFAIRDQLAIPQRFTPEQLEQARQGVVAMHRKGFSLNDRVQMGLDQYGRMMHYDVGKAAELPEDEGERNGRIEADEQELAKLYRQSGQEMPPFGRTAQKAVDGFSAAMESTEADYEQTAHQAINAARAIARDNPKAGQEAIRKVNETLRRHGMQRIEGPGYEDEPSYNPKTQRGQAIEETAADYEIDPEHLAQAADEEYEKFAEWFQEREEAKRRARNLTKITAKDLAYLENKGYDYAGATKLQNETGKKFRRWDSWAQQIAREHPGILGDADDPNADFSAELWTLLREGAQQMPSRDDPEILKAAAKRLVAMGATKSATAQIPAEEEMVPFCKLGLVQKYSRLQRVHIGR